jgi:hypothetical protein
MSDSLPSASHDPDSIEGSPPAHAEDRKAAAALSSLHSNEIGAESGNKSSSADQEALGKAMSRLEIAPGTDAAARTVDAKKTQAVTKKAVKVSAEDVNLLVGYPCLSWNRLGWGICCMALLMSSRYRNWT